MIIIWVPSTLADVQLNRRQRVARIKWLESYLLSLAVTGGTFIFGYGFWADQKSQVVREAVALAVIFDVKYSRAAWIGIGEFLKSRWQQESLLMVIRDINNPVFI